MRSPCRDFAHRKLQRLTSIAFKVDRVIFVRPALSAPVFVTTMRRAAYAQSVGMSFIRETKQRRAHFVADVLIADGSHRCAEEQVARMPYASPYCPRPAQIRRVHVESRARFAVLPSRRVRSHASRLARAHHFTIPKIRGDRLYFVRPLNKRFE